MSDAFNRWIQQIAEHPHLTEVYYRGIRDFESLEGANLVGFATLMHQLFRLYEEAYSGHLEGHADLHLWRGWETARATSADILEFRLGGVHARIGSMRSSRSSLISYSRQPSLQGCIANQWKMNELSNRRKCRRIVCGQLQGPSCR